MDIVIFFNILDKTSVYFIYLFISQNWCEGYLQYVLLEKEYILLRYFKNKYYTNDAKTAILI